MGVADFISIPEQGLRDAIADVPEQLTFSSRRNLVHRLIAFSIHGVNAHLPSLSSPPDPPVRAVPRSGLTKATAARRSAENTTVCWDDVGRGGPQPHPSSAKRGTTPVPLIGFSAALSVRVAPATRQGGPRPPATFFGLHATAATTRPLGSPRGRWRDPPPRTTAPLPRPRSPTAKSGASPVDPALGSQGPPPTATGAAAPSAPYAQSCQRAAPPQNQPCRLASFMAFADFWGSEPPPRAQTTGQAREQTENERRDGAATDLWTTCPAVPPSANRFRPHLVSSLRHPSTRRTRNTSTPARRESSARQPKGQAAVLWSLISIVAKVIY